MPIVLLTCLLALTPGCGNSNDGLAETTSTTSGGGSCSAGLATLSGVTLSFKRSETEIEVYRFKETSFTRDLAPGETSENTGTWAWSGEPTCELKLDHTAAPPDWP